MFDAVRKAEQEGHLLTNEAQRAAHYLRVDFERGGIHLPAGTHSLLLFDGAVEVWILLQANNFSVLLCREIR